MLSFLRQQGREPVTSRLSVVTAQLEATWEAIRANWPTVAEAVIVVYRPEKNDRRGHWHARQWRNGGGYFDEVMLNSLILVEPIEGALETLLHEAVHSRAETEGIQDTSRDNAYHNKRFAALAAEMGLQTVKDEAIGWRTPGLLPGVLEQYARYLPEWSEAHRLYQEELARAGGKTKGRQAVRLECGCGRILRVSRTTADEGGIRCDLCRSLFVDG